MLRFQNGSATYFKLIETNPNNEIPQIPFSSNNNY